MASLLNLPHADGPCTPRPILHPLDPHESATAAAAELLELARPVDLDGVAEIIAPAAQPLRELAAHVRAERNTARRRSTGAEASAVVPDHDPLPRLIAYLADLFGVPAPATPTSTVRRRRLALLALVRIRRGTS